MRRVIAVAMVALVLALILARPAQAPERPRWEPTPPPRVTEPVPILDKHIETILDAIVPVVDGRDDDEGAQK